MLDILEWAKRKKNKAYNKTKAYPGNEYFQNEYEQWIITVDRLMRYENLVDRNAMLYKLQCLEQFNNTKVPEWVKNVIKGANI